VAYAANLSVTGSAGPFNWSLSNGVLPPGLALDTFSTTSNCGLSGLPTAAGAFSFTVVVSDGNLADAVSYNVNIQPAVVVGFSITTAALPPAVVGQPYAFALQAANGAGPLAWDIFAGVLPPGVNMNAAGQISGTPGVTGSWGVTFRVTDGVATLQKVLPLNVNGTAGNALLEQQLRNRIGQGGIVPLGAAQLPVLNPAQVELGRQLFFDKILSGTQDVACATCHHPALGNGDRLNLSIGVGATGGIGPGRDHPSKVFIGRNAQPIFNIGLFPELFWDKRVGRPPLPPGPPPPVPPQVQTPEGPTTLQPDEAQALFPLVNLAEMRGTGHALDGLSNADYRNALVARLQALPGYVSQFNAAFGAGGMNVNNTVRAIAQYERSQTFVNAAWDRYLRGESGAITDPQKRGALAFFGRARCGTCHGGPLLTNFTTHNIGIPQFGPGQGNGTGTEDFGFENTTGNTNQRYQFRVPSLRNVAFTGPYMHNGAFQTLGEVVNHYNTKQASTNAFTGANMLQAADLAPTLLPTAGVLQNLSPLFLQVPSDLTPQEIGDILAFLQSLTDPAAINRRQEVPATVPSGLPVDQ
jgi:cytochrome c peroxidase